MSVFDELWFEDTKRQLRLARPDLSDKVLDGYIEKVLRKNKINPPCVLDNNYVHKKVNTNLDSMIDWIHATKPICGGYGVFYKNQNESVNNVARAVHKFLVTRTALKTHMKQCKPGSYEYKHSDMLQGGEKVCANAIYGSGGAEVSIFYNLYTAPSTTATAQSLISTAYAAFEQFMANGIKFTDVDECLRFISLIVSEKTTHSMSGIRYATRDELVDRLYGMLPKKKKTNRAMEIIRCTVDNLTREEVTRVYYKNNLTEFTQNCDEVVYRLRKIMRETKSFRAPVEKLMTPDLKKDLDIIWGYYSEFVHFNHPLYNRIFRIKTNKRSAVLVIDTDSNMVSIYDWITMMLECFVDRNNTNEPEELMYIAASTISVFMTNMITDTLATYCRISNMPKEYWKNINMKNEFFFDWLITTAAKKNYISSILLREGIPLNGKMDIKGLSFAKSVISDTVSKYMKSIVKDDLLGAKINLRDMLLRLDKLRDMIHDSFMEGKKEYGKPVSVKEFQHYTRGYSDMGVRGVRVWNLAYPENPLELPDNVMIIKLNATRQSDIEGLRDVEPDIYNRLISGFWESYKDPELTQDDVKTLVKGINCIAIPSLVEKIPDWVIPYIAVDSIVEDNSKSIFPLLESLSSGLISTRAGQKAHSNILRL